MEPLRTTIDDCAINSKHNDITQSSRVLSIPLIRCDDQLVFNRMIKQENIDCQVFNRIIKEEIIDDQVFTEIIKEEIIDETDHHNDGRLLQKGSNVVPFPLNVICGDQEFNENIKEENIDCQVFNRIIKEEIIDDQVFTEIIKEEIIDETDHHNDGRLLQKGSSVMPFPLNVICGDQEFNENIKQENIDCQVLNGIIKEEIIDETDHHNDSKLLKERTKTEKGNPINTEIKAEIDLFGSCEFKRTILNESNSSEFITCKNSNLYTNYLNKNPLTDNCVKMSTASNLSMHTKTHSEKKLYQCNFCDTQFSKVSRLKEHTRTHTREKPYKCRICDSVFSRASDLARHTITHPGEMPYKCDICDTGYHKLHALKIHKWTHIEGKPYKCDFCDMGFFRPLHLIRHTKTHSGVTPYKCYVCNTRFGRASHLTVHTRTHTKEKPYECDILLKKTI